MNKSRMEAFSYGVFAIAITLLILEIHLPFGTPPNQLGGVLYRLLPSLGAYVLSFFIVGLDRLVHQKHVHRIRTVTSPLLWISIIWLMFVSVTSVPPA